MRKETSSKTGVRGAIPTPTKNGQMVSAKIPAQLASLIKRLSDEKDYDMKKSFLCDALAMWAKSVAQYDIITADEQAPLQAISEYVEVIDMLSKVEL